MPGRVRAQDPEIFEDCHGDGLPDVTFFIEGPNDFSDTDTTVVPVSPGPGIASFDNLAAGTYTINEDVPGDFTSIFVYCSMADSDEQVPFEYNESLQGIVLEITDGMEVICDWYNIPDEQNDGTVIVHKRTCPVGYDDEAADFNDFFADCVTRTNDITFTLTP